MSGKGIGGRGRPRGNGGRARFGGIDVLEYSPVARDPGVSLAVPSEVTEENFQPHLRYTFYGALAAARVVLPAMREAGAGTLLFTTP